MKKQLKEELIALAEKVLSIKEQEQINSEELKNLAQALYDKLTVLNFTEKHLFSSEVSEGEVITENIEENTSAEEKNQPEQEKEPDRFAPDGTLFNDSEAITEPNTEKIKDIVAQMPPEAEKFEEMLENILPEKHQKNDVEDIGGVHYDHLPQFEPVGTQSKEPEKPRSLNDRLKRSFQVGVNERHAFVKHLFEGSTADYNRVLSQLNTMKTKEEAVNFVLNMVKPDYNNWEGKEEYEIRFLAVVESKFE